MVKLNMILAMDQKLGIGLKNDLPWVLKRDLMHFEYLTRYSSYNKSNNITNSVIMGRKTFDSIHHKPLVGRLNLIVSTQLTQQQVDNQIKQQQVDNQIKQQQVDKQIKQQQIDKQTIVVPSLQQAYVYLQQMGQGLHQHWVVGGKGLYEEALGMQQMQNVYITQLGVTKNTDVQLHSSFVQMLHKDYVLAEITKTQCENGIPYDFQRHTRKGELDSLNIDKQLLINKWGRHEEYEYLDKVQQVLTTGTPKSDRTGTGTLSCFGGIQRYDLKETFPLLTTKRTFMKAVIHELLWFIKGCTDNRQLKENGVHIWDGNSTRQYLDSIGLTNRQENDLGPIYGFQWRHFGAHYTDMHQDYNKQGIDQLQQLINTLKKEPTSRRLILTAWNPQALPQMALPPCHLLAQFYVNEGRLSCMMYQRSCDLGLGVPFNIASYALLTAMLAQVVGLQRGELVHAMGDIHVYDNHRQPLLQQLDRVPRSFPLLQLNPQVKDIDSFTYDDIQIIGYNPHPKIQMDMAV